MLCDCRAFCVDICLQEEDWFAVICRFCGLFPSGPASQFSEEKGGGRIRLGPLRENPDFQQNQLVMEELPSWDWGLTLRSRSLSELRKQKLLTKIAKWGQGLFQLDQKMGIF